MTGDRFTLEQVDAMVEASKPRPEARVLTCVYCGHEYPQDTPAWGSKVLTEHIATCEKHPMRKVVVDRDKLRAALVDLVGESDPDRLLEMRGVLLALPNLGDDRAAILNAITALLETAAGP